MNSSKFVRNADVSKSYFRVRLKCDNYLETLDFLLKLQEKLRQVVTMALKTLYNNS